MTFPTRKLLSPAFLEYGSKIPTVVAACDEDEGA